MTTSLSATSSLAQVIAKINEIIVKHDALQDLSDDMSVDVDFVKSETTKLRTRVNSNQSQYLGNVQFLQDVSNVTAFVSGASVGRRLRYVLDQLKAELIVMIEDMANTSRPVDLGPLGEEINKAIALVDANVPDGIKLDFRLQQNEKNIRALLSHEDQTIWIPYATTVEQPTSLTIQAIKPEHAVFLQADVTVVTDDKKPAKTDEMQKIKGTMNGSGLITLNYLPVKKVHLWYPIEVQRKYVQDKDLWNILEVIQMGSGGEINNDEIEEFMAYVREQLEIMKGIDYNSEQNIADAYQLIEKTRLAPKSLQITQLPNDQLAVQFSYEDHPLLSHFVLEKWDEETKTWLPYDGDEGIVTLPVRG